MFYSIDMRKKRKLLFPAVLIMAIGIVFVGLNYMFPVKYYDIIEEYSAKYGLSPQLVCAMIWAESGFEPEAKSNKDASGLMQVIKQTADWAEEEIGIENYDYSRISEPEMNIQIGCWYMGRLITQYGGNVDTALAAYNAGSGNVAKWLGEETEKGGNSLSSIPFSETRVYVERVHMYEKIYALLLKLHTKQLQIF